MRVNRPQIFLTTLLTPALAVMLVLVATGAQAQLTVSSRLTTLRYGWVHGGGPDVHSGEVLSTVPDLLLSDSRSEVFHDATAGQWFTHDWNTSVDAWINQSYAMTGTLNQVRRIQASHSTRVRASASGDIGLASMSSNNPGNELVFYFGVKKPSNYRFTGSIVGGASASTWVAMQRYNGFTWDYLFLSYSYPGDDINWDVNGTFDPNQQYRLISGVDNGAGSNQDHTKTLTYDFNISPRLTVSPHN